MIAEDEAIVRLDLREILEEAGFEIAGETGRGDEAVRLVREHAPDLVILDIKMPGIDGLEAASAISGLGSTAVLILTAFSQRELVDKARDAGAIAYLVKPFQKEEILPAIDVALARHAELRALETENAALHDENRRYEEQLETRRWVDRAKGHLMDTHAMRESEAFAFIQKTAMDRRTAMREVAQGIVDRTIVPD